MAPWSPTRRELLRRSLAVAAASSVGASASVPAPGRAAARVVVIGGGFGGATAAKYLRLWSNGSIAVTLVEADAAFVSCPLSNLVLDGSRRIDDLTVSYRGLARHGVNVLRDTASAIDVEKNRVRLASGATLAYDRLVVSPGIEFIWDSVLGMSAATAEQIPHAWQAGPQTVLLRRRLEAMADGGTVLISVPLIPYRCPPGPYERACQIAHYLQRVKPKSKLIVLDANPEMVSKKPLFTRVFNEDYRGIIDYRNDAPVAEVDVSGRAFILDLGDRITGDVLNLIPPQRATRLARDAGLVTANDRWCEVDWLTMESIKASKVHVLGDATLAAETMPKSGHVANQHGKLAAAAIVELLNGRQPIAPTITSTCYSFIDDKNAVHVASVFRWAAETRTLSVVPGTSGTSSQDRATWAQEGVYAMNWARTLWADMLA